MKGKGLMGLLVSALLILGLVMACAPAAPTTPTPTTPTPTTPTPTTPTPTTPAGPVKMFTLEDTPEIKNRTPIHVAVMGFTAPQLEPEIRKWQEHTGFPLTYESMTFEVVYPKLNLELVAATGSYDCIPVEASYTCEWSPYLFDMYELADTFDPGGAAALRADMDQQYPAIIRQTSDRSGKLCGVPFFTYQCGMILRQDVYDDATEQANFKTEYGYDLVPPTTYDELYDHAAFFTRKKGELLKGVPLEWDLYGEAIMGRVEINDETSGEIYARGGHWMDIERDAEGNAIGFVVTKENKKVITEALSSLKMQLDNWCSPGCLTGWWDYTIPQFIQGRHIIMPHGYMDFWGWIDDIYDVIPDADVRGYHSPGTGVAYPGNFYQAVPLASGNPEATYWLMRYLASEEAQRAMIEKAMAGTRMDVLSDPKYQTGDWERAVGRQNAALDMLFTTTETAEVMDDYIWFNSTAGGKIYEMTIIKCHEAVVGIKTIDDAVDEIINQMVSLQTKYGDLPVRNET